MSALENRKYVVQAEYDFSKDGGAVGAVALRGGALPAGAVITSGVVDVQTAVLSGGAATIAIRVENAADILAVTGKADLTVGQLDVKQDGAATNMIKTTANNGITATIGGAAITAGRFVVALEYFITS